MACAAQMNHGVSGMVWIRRSDLRVADGGAAFSQVLHRSFGHSQNS